MQQICFKLSFHVDYGNSRAASQMTEVPHKAGRPFSKSQTEGPQVENH